MKTTGRHRTRGASAMSYVLLLVVAAGGMGSILATSNPASPGGLSAARNLAGTWKDLVAVPVSFADNMCGNMQLAGTQPWTVTFIITSGATSNEVNVEMDFTQGSFTSAGTCASGGVTPEVSPLFLTGVISSSNLVLMQGNTTVGNFNFTSSIMTGTFNYTWTQAYSQQEYTAANALTLTKQ